LSIYFKNMDVVVPGDVIAEGDFKIIEGAFREHKKIIASIIGILYFKKNTIRVVPLKGPYMPKRGDHVIGKIVDCSTVSWSVDIRAPYLGRLDATDYFGKPIDPSREDIRKTLKIGDIIFAKVAVVDRFTNPQLVAHGPALGKLIKGKIVEVEPLRIPRILGKNRSMIKMLREVTKAEIKVGNNGRIWIRSPDPEIEKLLIKVIKKIERESHVPGLTERIRKTLLNELKDRLGEFK